jgi:HEAT repeat protein
LFSEPIFKIGKNKMKPINSIAKFREVWIKDGLEHAMIGAEDFLRQAAKNKHEDVKELLIEIVRGRHDINSSQAIAWLVDYEDLTLLPLLIESLQDERLRTQSLYAFMIWAENGIIHYKRDEEVVNSLADLLSQDPPYYTCEIVINVLAALEATGAIDLVTAYLSNSHPAVRSSAARCVLRLSVKEDRNDIVTKILPLLQDPHPGVPPSIALSLKQYYPDRFVNLDPKNYFPGQ